MKKYLYVTVLLAVSFSLNGCSSQNKMESLKNFVNDGPKVPGKIEPLPKIPSYRADSYKVSPKDPFLSFSDIQLLNEEQKAKQVVVPGRTGPTTPLESFGLSSLRLTGFVRGINGVWWAIFSTPKNTVYRISTGMGIGEKQGRVLSIDPKKRTVIVEQYVPNAFGGYTPEKVTIRMSGIH